MRCRSDLRPYQKEDIDHILSGPASMLWSDMGLGKTISALTAITDLFWQLKIHGCLVLAPLSVVKAVWRQEARGWEHTKHLTFSVVHGTPKERVAALKKSAMIYLLNYEGLPWMVKELAKEKRGVPFNMVVYDEVTRMKNSTSNRSKAMRKLLPLVDYAIGLTGTPAPNGLLDLFGQYLCVDKGARLGTSKTAYRDAYFMSDYMGYSWTLRQGSRGAITSKISDITRQRKKEDYLTLPPVDETTRLVQFSDKERKAYDLLEKDYFVELDAGDEIEAFNAAALSNKCMQFANGACYDNEERRKWHHASEAKMDALKDVISEIGDKPVLLSYNFKHDLERIQKEFPHAVHVTSKNVSEVQERWNRGEIKLLVGHPKSIGHGLNLQYGGHYLIMFGVNWDLELYLQIIGRFDRSGKIDTTFVIRLIVENTMEEAVVTALQAKDADQAALRKSIKTYREGKR